MAQLVSDDFNRADSTGLGSNWTAMTGKTAHNVVANQAKNVGGGERATFYSGAGWTASSPADQYAECKVVVVAAGGDAGPAVRYGAVGGLDMYYFAITGLGSSLTHRLYTVLNGSFVSATTWIGTVTAADVVRIEAQGTTVRCKVGATTVITWTLSDHADGEPGIFSFAANTIIDDFAAGDFTAGGAVTCNPDVGSVPISGQLTRLHLKIGLPVQP